MQNKRYSCQKRWGDSLSRKKKHLKTSDRIYIKINYKINISTGDDKLIEVIWRIISLIRRDEKEKIEGIYR